MEVSKISRERKWMKVLNAKAYIGDSNSVSCCSHYALSSLGLLFWERAQQSEALLCSSGNQIAQDTNHKTLQKWTKRFESSGLYSWLRLWFFFLFQPFPKHRFFVFVVCSASQSLRDCKGRKSCWKWSSGTKYSENTYLGIRYNFLNDMTVTLFLSTKSDYHRIISS